MAVYRMYSGAVITEAMYACGDYSACGGPGNGEKQISG